MEQCKVLDEGYGCQDTEKDPLVKEVCNAVGLPKSGMRITNRDLTRRSSGSPRLFPEIFMSFLGRTYERME